MTEVFLTILWCLCLMGGGIFVYLAHMNAQRNVKELKTIVDAIEKYQGKVEAIELILATLTDEQAKMKSDLTVVKGVATLGRK